MMNTNDDKVLNIIPSEGEIGTNYTIDTEYLRIKLRFRLSNMEESIMAVFDKDDTYYETDINSSDTDIYEITAEIDAKSISPIYIGESPLNLNDSNEFADLVAESIMSNKEIRERILDAQLPAHKQLTYNTVVLISNADDRSIIIPIETHEKEEA